MKFPKSLLLLIVLLPTTASAAQIYGSLKIGDRAVGQGVNIEITCNNPTPYTGVTDAYGSYSINARSTGRCMFKVFYEKKWTPPFPVYSEADPVRYDFSLELQSDGTYALRRR